MALRLRHFLAVIGVKDAPARKTEKCGTPISAPSPQFSTVLRTAPGAPAGAALALKNVVIGGMHPSPE